MLLFPSASDPLGRQGFVRVVNRSDEAGDVYIDAFDNTGVDYEPLTLTVGAGETVHFNSDDLELRQHGEGPVGEHRRRDRGIGAWRSGATLDDRSTVLHSHGATAFLTSMHDVATDLGSRATESCPSSIRVSNVNQVSRLRLVNHGR